MSIFGKIKDAIFGKKAEAQTNAPVAAAPAAGATPPAAAPVPAAPTAISEVDVEAILTDVAAKNPQKLNWRTSIVDLLKLLDLDSSLDNRKELAKELGYTGAADGSAEFNIWLQKAVLRELAKNGGKVPADLID
jgi:3-oxoacyl-ACP reductase-like protein